MQNLLNVKNFLQMYSWMECNCKSKDFVWVNTKRGKPNNLDFSYIDAVYCALCFGWIDSVCKNINGITYQKFSPRRKNSHWSYLNIKRCEYLIKKGYMKESGLATMPKNRNFSFISEDIIEKLKSDEKAFSNFKNFPELYRNIRIDNIEWARKNKKLFEKRVEKLIFYSKNNKMYGEWNDYGRLL